MPEPVNLDYGLCVRTKKTNMKITRKFITKFHTKATYDTVPVCGHILLNLFSIQDTVLTPTHGFTNHSVSSCFVKPLLTYWQVRCLQTVTFTLTTIDKPLYATYEGTFHVTPPRLQKYS